MREQNVLKPVDHLPGLLQPSREDNDIYPVNVFGPIDNNPRIAINLDIIQPKTTSELKEKPKREELPLGVDARATSHPEFIKIDLI